MILIFKVGLDESWEYYQSIECGGRVAFLFERTWRGHTNWYAKHGKCKWAIYR